MRNILDENPRLCHLSNQEPFKKDNGMPTPKKHDGLDEKFKAFEERIIHQLHVTSEDNRSQIKQLAEGVANLNEKLDRFREETRSDAENKFSILSQAITRVDDKLERTRQELKAEIQEVRQEFGEKLDQTRQELKAEIHDSRKEFNEKLDKVQLELKTENQASRQEILAAIKFSYAELDRRLTTLEKEFLDLKHRIEKIESHRVS